MASQEPRSTTYPQILPHQARASNSQSLRHREDYSTHLVKNEPFSIEQSSTTWEHLPYEPPPKRLKLEVSPPNVTFISQTKWKFPDSQQWPEVQQTGPKARNAAQVPREYESMGETHQQQKLPEAQALRQSADIGLPFDDRGARSDKQKLTSAVEVQPILQSSRSGQRTQSVDYNAPRSGAYGNSNSKSRATESVQESTFPNIQSPSHNTQMSGSPQLPELFNEADTDQTAEVRSATSVPFAIGPIKVIPRTKSVSSKGLSLERDGERIAALMAEKRKANESNMFRQRLHQMQLDHQKEKGTAKATVGKVENADPTTPEQNPLQSNQLVTSQSAILDHTPTTQKDVPLKNKSEHPTQRSSNQASKLNTSTSKNAAVPTAAGPPHPSQNAEPNVVETRFRPVASNSSHPKTYSTNKVHANKNDASQMASSSLTNRQVPANGVMSAASAAKVVVATDQSVESGKSLQRPQAAPATTGAMNVPNNHNSRFAWDRSGQTPMQQKRNSLQGRTYPDSMRYVSSPPTFQYHAQYASAVDNQRPLAGLTETSSSTTPYLLSQDQSRLGSVMQASGPAPTYYNINQNFYLGSGQVSTSHQNNFSASTLPQYQARSPTGLPSTAASSPQNMASPPYAQSPQDQSQINNHLHSTVVPRNLPQPPTLASNMNMFSGQARAATNIGTRPDAIRKERVNMFMRGNVNSGGSPVGTGLVMGMEEIRRGIEMT